MALPETRHSLIARLNNRDDASAWVEFCAIYEPATYRIARRFGLQDADAREVSQEVLLTVSRNILRFDVARNGSFRGWLMRIARNATIDLLRRSAKNNPRQSELWRRVDALPANELSESIIIEQETRKQLFMWAAEQVRQTVNEATWQAFWLTSVEGVAGTEVARQLGLSVGTVYVARCRTLARIKSLVQSFQEAES